MLLLLALVTGASASLVISEIADKDGVGGACDGEEWVELHNAGDATATLDSLFLHDDKGAAHEDALALSGSLGAGEYLLLCRKVDFEFKIGGSDTISISNSGEVVDTTPACCADSDERTYGRVHGTSEFAVLATPSPGAANGAAAMLAAPSPVFEPTRGFFAAPFDLTVSAAGASLTVSCTVDGSDPSIDGAQIATSGAPPLTIRVDPSAGANRTWAAPAVGVRCVTTGASLRPSATATHTYIFPEAVLDQPEHVPEGSGVFWTTAMTLNGADADASRTEQLAALSAIPTMSIAMPHEELFGVQGIHRGPNLEEDDYEFGASVELLYPDGDARWAGFDGFQVDAGVRIQGGGGRWREGEYDHKQSFSLKFRTEYGYSKLRYPVFESAPATTKVGARHGTRRTPSTRAISSRATCRSR